MVQFATLEVPETVVPRLSVEQVLGIALAAASDNDFL
jgi:hypothetical protein